MPKVYLKSSTMKVDKKGDQHRKMTINRPSSRPTEKGLHSKTKQNRKKQQLLGLETNSITVVWLYLRMVEIVDF